jgi:hypothetical protein
MLLEYRKCWWQNSSNGRIERKKERKKKKSGKSPGEVTWIFNCINMQKTCFMGDYWFFK